MKTKKIPFRKCVGCKEQKSKNELIRVVKTKEALVELDTTGKKNGRGAYICCNESCLEKAFKTKALNRSLSTNVSEEVYKSMKDILKSE